MRPSNFISPNKIDVNIWKILGSYTIPPMSAGFMCSLSFGLLTHEFIIISVNNTTDISPKIIIETVSKIESYSKFGAFFVAAISVFFLSIVNFFGYKISVWALGRYSNLSIRVPVNYFLIRHSFWWISLSIFIGILSFAIQPLYMGTLEQSILSFLENHAPIVFLLGACWAYFSSIKEKNMAISCRELYGGYWQCLTVGSIYIAFLLGIIWYLPLVIPLIFIT